MSRNVTSITRVCALLFIAIFSLKAFEMTNRLLKIFLLSVCRMSPRRYTLCSYYCLSLHRIKKHIWSCWRQRCCSTFTLCKHGALRKHVCLENRSMVVHGTRPSSRSTTEMGCTPAAARGRRLARTGTRVGLCVCVLSVPVCARGEGEELKAPSNTWGSCDGVESESLDERRACSHRVYLTRRLVTNPPSSRTFTRAWNLPRRTTEPGPQFDNSLLSAGTFTG